MKGIIAMMHSFCFASISLVILSLVNADNTENYTKQSINTCMSPDASSPLSRARNLKAPLATDTQDAEFEHSTFWDDNGPLLQDAWAEFEEGMKSCVITSSNDVFINPVLSNALENAFDNPTEETESTVKTLWTTSTSIVDDEHYQPLPRGVFATQLLTESGIIGIRELLDAATSSGIPTRRPNGMNRHGVIVDPEVYGAVPMKSLLRLVEDELINRVVRPVGRMLFPDRVGCEDDIEYFAFTIKYDGSDDDGNNNAAQNDANIVKRDFELKEHRDASVVTLNINLNLPEEGYAGSEVYFREYPSEEATGAATNDDVDRIDGGTVQFSPGMAIIHLGAHRHGSLPISASNNRNGSGKRYNLVIWLFGKDGDVRIAPYKDGEQMNVVERWRGCNNTQSFSFE